MRFIILFIIVYPNPKQVCGFMHNEREKLKRVLIYCGKTKWKQYYFDSLRLLWNYFFLAPSIIELLHGFYTAYAYTHTHAHFDHFQNQNIILLVIVNFVWFLCRVASEYKTCEINLSMSWIQKWSEKRLFSAFFLNRSSMNFW